MQVAYHQLLAKKDQYVSINIITEISFSHRRNNYISQV